MNKWESSQSTTTLRSRLEIESRSFLQRIWSTNTNVECLNLIFQIHLNWFKDLMMEPNTNMVPFNELDFKESLNLLQNQLVERWNGFYNKSLLLQNQNQLIHGNDINSIENNFQLFLKLFLAERFVILFNYSCFVVENGVVGNITSEQIEKEKNELEKFLNSLPQCQWKEDLISNFKQTISQSINTFGLDSLSM